jgi:hypothetical protein
VASARSHWVSLLQMDSSDGWREKRISLTIRSCASQRAGYFDSQIYRPICIAG